jgi:hypothetical protein
MLIQGGQRSIESLGLGERHTAKIKQTKSAFKILSSGIYSNKIRAVIRELACNAADAHIAAGTQSVPFLVHLPNHLEPWFSIRDYGTGLSHEDVINLYTTYFESSKTNSNEFTGCLGLGSKSPLAYTDNFTVVSYFGGVKRTYSWFFDEDEMPCISQIGESECSEHDGLEVHLAVNKDDFDAFREEAEDVLKYFKNPPKVVGAKVDLNINLIHDEGDFAITGGRHDGVVAVMGNVAYPVEFNWSNGLGNTPSWLYDSGVILYYKIGDLDIAASREQLGYTAKTNKALQTTLKDVEEKLLNIVQSEIDKCGSYVEACRKAHVMRQAHFWMGRLKYKGQGLKNFCSLDFNIASFTEGSRGGISREQTTHIAYVGEVKYVVADIGLTSVARCRQAVNSNNTIYLIQPELVQEFLKQTELDKSELINVSTLPYVPAAKSNSGGQVFKGLYSITQGNYGKPSTWWERHNDTVNDITGAYVLFSKYDAVGAGGLDKLWNQVWQLRELGLKDVNCYGVRPREEERAIENGWIKWEEYRRETVENFVAAHKDEIAYHKEKVDGDLIHQLITLKRLGVDNDLINELEAEQNKVTSSISGRGYDQLEYLMREFDIKIKPATRRTEIIRALQNQYPMLQCVDWAKAKGHVALYMSQIDAWNKLNLT